MGTNNSPQFVSAHTRAQIAKAMLFANAAVAAVSLIFHLITLGGWGQPDEDIASLEETISSVELLHGLVGLTQIAVYVATAALFLVWLHRAYKNLRALGVRTEQSPGWVVGSWFIPILNLFRPYQSVKEAWIKSDPGVDFSGGFAQPGPQANPATLVGFWWGFWLFSNFVGRIAWRIARRAETPDQLSNAAMAGAFSDLLIFVAAALAFLVVSEIDRMQEEKAARLNVSAWPSPPPPPASFDPAHAAHNSDDRRRPARPEPAA